MAFPINYINERNFDTKWTGDVFICDIDRTYLYTRFSTLKGMAQIPFEFAIDKKAIEGMVPLLREVRRGPEKSSRHTPLYFISASPAQLRPVIHRKMLLDGLEFDGTIFKDWKKVIKGMRLRRLREQLGFKLTALLMLQKELPGGASTVLIGDDLESDALAFALFADIVSRQIDEKELLKRLKQNGVADDDAEEIGVLGRIVPAGFRVKRAYIRMDRTRTPEELKPYWPHIVTCKGAFQIALSLWNEGSVSSDGVVRVAHELLGRGFSTDEFLERLLDGTRRGIIDRSSGEVLLDRLTSHGIPLPRVAFPEADPAWIDTAEKRKALPWTALV